MSLYYYALHTLQYYTETNIDRNPIQSVSNLDESVKELCEISYKKLNDEVDKVKYADESTLPYRCFQLTYITVLLEDIYGFDKDSENISFLGKINGNEVEWTLGVALFRFHDN